MLLLSPEETEGERWHPAAYRKGFILRVVWLQLYVLELPVDTVSALATYTCSWTSVFDQQCYKATFAELWAEKYHRQIMPLCEHRFAEIFSEKGSVLHVMPFQPVKLSRYVNIYDRKCDSDSMVLYAIQSDALHSKNRVAAPFHNLMESHVALITALAVVAVGNLYPRLRLHLLLRKVRCGCFESDPDWCDLNMKCSQVNRNA